MKLLHYMEGILYFCIKKYMQHYNRLLKQLVIQALVPGKVVVIYGARRVGKTTLINNILEEIPDDHILLNGDDLSTIEMLRDRKAENYRKILGNIRLLVIDEAQSIPDIGLILKLMIDSVSGLKILVSGSSSFDLGNKIGEPLTGRKRTFIMFPVSIKEIRATENYPETFSRLEERVIFGMYPEVLNSASYKEKSDYLTELINSYLLKDILSFDGIRNASKMFDLLRLVAYQVGQMVSLEELGRQLSISRNTVEKYLDLLTKVFVLYRLPGFSRNLRSEVVKTSKWYFYDNGVRNALIRDFNKLSIRNDTGALWESFLFSERIKFQQYTGLTSHNYFWRNYAQQEIDWIEDRDGKLYANEIKWNPGKKAKVPNSWANSYPEAEFKLINKDNYLEWVI